MYQTAVTAHSSATSCTRQCPGGRYVPGVPCPSNARRSQSYVLIPVAPSAACSPAPLAAVATPAAPAPLASVAP
eukprot:6806842-Prymnesium_polylepis.1